MAVEAFQQTVAGISQADTASSQQATQQQQTIRAEIEKVYENAGQQPPTPQTAGGIAPHVKGGIKTTIIIVILLWLSFCFYRWEGGHAQSVVPVPTGGE